MCRANVTFKKLLGDDFAVRFSLRKACRRFGSRRINLSTVESQTSALFHYKKKELHVICLFTRCGL